MKTIAIIPARGGSKRLPNKNAMLLGQVPLIAHSIAYAKANLGIIDAIYVSTNDPKIKEIAMAHGVNVIERPEHLSGDFEPTVSALRHVLENLEHEIENVIVLQLTNPLRPENMLKEAFEMYESKKRNSLFTVSQNHHKLGTINDEKFYPSNYSVGQRSQDLTPLFYENGLLYIVKAKAVFDDKIITDDAFPFLVNHIFAKVDVDTQEDFDYANYLYQKMFNLKI